MSNKAKTATMKNDGKSALTPKLRFPDFQNAGEWENKPLSACLDYHQPTPYLVSDTNYNPAFKTPVLTAGKTFILGYTSEQHGIFSEDLPVIIFDDFTTASQFVDFPFKAKSSAMKILQAKNGANIKFMYETLQMLSYEVGVHERHWISNFAPMLVSVPKPPEQQKIADCLTSVDELIAAQARKVDALKTHKKGLMQKLFPREGETQPRLRFPEFQDAGEWEEGQITDIGTVLQGYGFPKRHQGLKNGDYPFYKVSDISKSLVAGKVFIEEAANYINENLLKELRAKPIPSGTTIFAKIGEAIRSNKRVITTVPCLIDNNAAGIKRKKGKATDFFVYLTVEQISLIEHAGGVVPAVNKSAIEAIPVKFPAIEEQQRIADCLTSLDDLIAVQTQKLGVLKTHKKGLMQQLFPQVVEDDA